MSLGIVSLQAKEAKHSRVKEDFTLTNRSNVSTATGKWWQVMRSNYVRSFSQNINQYPLLIPHTANYVLHHTVTNQMFVIVVEIKKTICSVVKFVCLVLT